MRGPTLSPVSLLCATWAPAEKGNKTQFEGQKRHSWLQNCQISQDSCMIGSDSPLQKGNWAFKTSEGGGLGQIAWGDLWDQRRQWLIIISSPSHSSNICRRQPLRVGLPLLGCLRPVRQEELMMIRCSCDDHEVRPQQHALPLLHLSECQGWSAQPRTFSAQGAAGILQDAPPRYCAICSWWRTASLLWLPNFPCISQDVGTSLHGCLLKVD